MIDYNKTIYKKDSKGKIRVLHVITEEINGEHVLMQKSGLLGSDKLIVHSKLGKPKNIGKSNEVTAQEHTWSMAQSVLNRKLKADYFETEEEAINNVVYLPMLADKYKERKKKIDWENCYVQPKFDGQRCLAICKPGEDIILLSREGTEIGTMPHIVEELKKITSALPTVAVFDGELYAHGLSFQENMKLIKKNRPGSFEISYHVYDIVLDEPFADRNVLLDKFIPFDSLNHIERVSTLRVLDEENVRNLHQNFVSLGYEGSMVRHGESGYKLNGRSTQLLKNKDFIDIAIPLKFVRPKENRPHLGQAVFEWEGAKNDYFVANFKGTETYQADILTNKKDYVGKMCEVRFFEYTDDGVPRFPVVVGFRNDK